MTTQDPCHPCNLWLKFNAHTILHHDAELIAEDVVERVAVRERVFGALLGGGGD